MKLPFMVFVFGLLFQTVAAMVGFLHPTTAADTPQTERSNGGNEAIPYNTADLGSSRDEFLLHESEASKELTRCLKTSWFFTSCSASADRVMAEHKAILRENGTPFKSEEPQSAASITDSPTADRGDGNKADSPIRLTPASAFEEYFQCLKQGPSADCTVSRKRANAEVDAILHRGDIKWPDSSTPSHFPPRVAKEYSLCLETEPILHCSDALIRAMRDGTRMVADSKANSQDTSTDPIATTSAKDECLACLKSGKPRSCTDSCVRWKTEPDLSLAKINLQIAVWTRRLNSTLKRMSTRVDLVLLGFTSGPKEETPASNIMTDSIDAIRDLLLEKARKLADELFPAAEESREAPRVMEEVEILLSLLDRLDMIETSPFWPPGVKTSLQDSKHPEKEIETKSVQKQTRFHRNKATLPTPSTVSDSVEYHLCLSYVAPKAKCLRSFPPQTPEGDKIRARYIQEDMRSELMGRYIAFFSHVVEKRYPIPDRDKVFEWLENATSTADPPVVSEAIDIVRVIVMKRVMATRKELEDATIWRPFQEAPGLVREGRFLLQALDLLSEIDNILARTSGKVNQKTAVSSPGAGKQDPNGEHPFLDEITSYHPELTQTIPTIWVTYSDELFLHKRHALPFASHILKDEYKGRYGKQYQDFTKKCYDDEYPWEKLLEGRKRYKGNDLEEMKGGGLRELVRGQFCGGTLVGEARDGCKAGH